MLSQRRLRKTIISCFKSCRFNSTIMHMYAHFFPCAQEIEKYVSYCEEEFRKAQTISSMQMSDWHDVPWTEFFSNQTPKSKIPPTGVDMATIKTICSAISTPPKDIESHLQVSLRDR